jgi:peptidoglycan-N-acetylglucosamine deacetylase
MTLFEAITNIETRDPIAALTFDDGPHPIYTPRVLNILEKHGMRSTFFMIGEAARKYPEIVKMVARGGHVIGNHCWNHVYLPGVGSRLSRLRQLWAGARATAPHCKRLFRPPYGAHNDAILLDARILGYKVILWSASAQDWLPQQPEDIARKIIDRIIPGTIFLLHDGLSSGAGQEKSAGLAWNREPMLQGLEKSLAVLKERLRFVTIPELLQTGRPSCNWPGPPQQSTKEAS